MSSESKNLTEIIRQRNVEGYKRHIFLCAGPNCCSEQVGQETWEYFKKRLKELGLVDTAVYRTKVHCLRICRDGPNAVVFPEGVWYQKLDKEACEQVIQQHLKGGRPVEEHIFARNNLSGPS